METQAAREIKFTRVFCGAMLFPTIATIFGKFIFRNVQGNFRRSLLGGLTFVVAKGMLKIYLKQKIYSSSGDRKIADYNPEITPEATSSTNTD